MPALELCLTLRPGVGTEELACVMCNLNQRYPQTTILVFTREVFSRYARGRVLTATIVTPDQNDWISEFCEANRIPIEKGEADRGYVKLTVRPKSETQATTLLEALIEDSVWTYSDEVLLSFRTPTASTKPSESVFVTELADGKGFACQGNPSRIKEVRELIEQVAIGFAPPVVLKDRQHLSRDSRV